MAATDPFDAQRLLWSMGDYTAVAHFLEPISADLVETAGIGSGDRVLDVGVGNGNTAIVAARLGAKVTGVDLTPRQLELAAERIAAEGLAVELQEGNAEDLPYDDASFDAVVSVMGVIFAPDHARAAAELARVCRPGGTVAITAWAQEGWSWVWRQRAADLVAAAQPGGPQPDAWGVSAELVRRLETVGLDVTVAKRPLAWTFASVDEAVAFFSEKAGPFIAFAQAAKAAGNGDRFYDELRAVMAESNESTDGTLVLPAPYLLAVAKRN